MPQIILRERTANEVSYSFFKRDVDQYSNTSLPQLYQPPRTTFSQGTYHWLLSSYEYCKVFKNELFIEHLQRRSFADYFQNRVNAFANFARKHLCWSLFLKTYRLKACNFIKKDSNTSAFL